MKHLLQVSLQKRPSWINLSYEKTNPCFLMGKCSRLLNPKKSWEVWMEKRMKIFPGFQWRAIFRFQSFILRGCRSIQALKNWFLKKKMGLFTHTHNVEINSFWFKNPLLPKRWKRCVEQLFVFCLYPAESWYILGFTNLDSDKLFHIQWIHVWYMYIYLYTGHSFFTSFELSTRNPRLPAVSPCVVLLQPEQDLQQLLTLHSHTPMDQLGPGPMEGFDLYR